MVRIRNSYCNFSPYLKLSSLSSHFQSFFLYLVDLRGLAIEYDTVKKKKKSELLFTNQGEDKAEINHIYMCVCVCVCVCNIYEQEGQLDKIIDRRILKNKRIKSLRRRRY